jgi:hypothetical protein
MPKRQQSGGQFGRCRPEASFPGASSLPDSSLSGALPEPWRSSVANFGAIREHALHPLMADPNHSTR